MCRGVVGCVEEWWGMLGSAGMFYVVVGCGAVRRNVLGS